MRWFGGSPLVTLAWRRYGDAMSTLLDEPETLELADQHAFNVAVWKKLIEDASLAELPNRIETDELGQIIMTPPPAPEHGEEQVDIGALLKALMKRGHTIAECPVSTSGGVKGVDVAWISRERREPQRGEACFTEAPEICVEIVSPSNSRRELKKKKRLYFEAGAEEVWLREPDGRMAFYLKAAPDVAVEASILCPEFPSRVE
jgi:Uma2 family endonuclease